MNRKVPHLALVAGWGTFFVSFSGCLVGFHDFFGDAAPVGHFVAVLARPGPDFLGSGGDPGALDGLALAGEDLRVVHIGGHDLDERVVVVVVEVEVAALPVDPHELDTVSTVFD